MIITAPPKTGKTWMLVQLAESIATGACWLGFPCKRGRVLYVNFEISEGDFNVRLKKVAESLSLNNDLLGNNLAILNMRGGDNDLRKIADRIISLCTENIFTCVIIDPLYKFINGDENKSDVTTNAGHYMDEIAETGAAVVYAHHFTKGDSSMKNNIDKGSGSGVLSRDPDAILSINALNDLPNDETGIPYRIEVTTRSFPVREPINVWYKYPLFVIDDTGELSNREIASSKIKAMEKRREERAKQWKTELDRAFKACIANGKGIKLDTGGIGVKTNDIVKECTMSTNKQTIMPYLKKYYIEIPSTGGTKQATWRELA